MTGYERRTLSWPGDGPPVTVSFAPAPARYDVLVFDTTGLSVLGPGRRARFWPYPRE